MTSPPMKITDLKTNDDVAAEWSAADRAFRAERERTSLAHAISLIVLRNRTDHGLSQRALGNRLGMTQPHVSRIESGDANPSMDTLFTLSASLGIELAISIQPAGASLQLVAKQALTTPLHVPIDTPRVSILVAARA